MALIDGTSGNDTLPGTTDADVINGFAGNDSINSGSGNDTVDGGDGNDTINGGLNVDSLTGGDGDDLFIQDRTQPQFGPGDTIGGGAGTDTIEVRAVPSPAPTAVGLLSPHVFYSANQQTGGVGTSSTITSVERLDFASNAGQFLQSQFSFAQFTAAGISTVEGGAGRDIVIFVAQTGGSFATPTLTLQNWDAPALNAWQNTGDAISLVANPVFATNLTAADGFASFQVLTGGAGDDTLNGSNNGDLLNGGGGVNQLIGDDGNDSLAIVNAAAPNFGAPGTYLPVTYFTGQGSTFDGGDGTDVLTIGGVVEFLGTLANIEGINLLPSFFGAFPIPRQEFARLEIDATTLAALGPNFFVRGDGEIEVRLGADQSIDLSGVQFIDGSEAVMHISGSDDESAVAATWVGSSHGDIIEYAAGLVTATGGLGDDLYDIEVDGSGELTIADFTQGEDQFVTDVGSYERLLEVADARGGFANESNNLVLTLSEVDEGVTDTVRVVIQNTQLSDLDASDFYFLAPDGPETETGGPEDDFLFGSSYNDTLQGNAGNDRIYSGGGRDSLDGGSGNDTIVLDQGPLLGGSTLAGGDGIDTLLLRNWFDQPTSHSIVYPEGLVSSSHVLVGSTVSSIERVVFDSDVGTGVSLQLAFNQIGTGISATAVMVGGNGADSVILNANYAAGSSITAPLFTYTNWTTPDRAFDPGDRVIILVSGNANGTITASAHEGVMHLGGGNGNDTLIGTDGMESFSGGAGVNVIDAGGGNDALQLINATNFFLAANGTVQFSGTPTLTGAGSLFNGGEGIDFLVLGGTVDFQGNVQSIEGIHLATVFPNYIPAQGSGQAGFTGSTSSNPTYVEIAIDTLEAMDDFQVSGTGIIDPDLDQGDSFDLSDVVFDTDAEVTFFFDGESDGPGGPVTWKGTSRGDVFEFGSDDVTVTGGGGADRYSVGTGDFVITDFLIGTDKFDVTESDDEAQGAISSFDLLADYAIATGGSIRQEDADVVIELRVYDEGTAFPVHGVVQNVQLGALAANGFDFAGAPAGAVSYTGTLGNDLLIGGAFNDLLDGGAGNDIVLGGAGNDTITSGAGDSIVGGGGDDLIVVSGALPSSGAQINGGAGIDTAEFAGNRDDYIAGAGVNGAVLVGPDSLSEIEFFRFADGIYRWTGTELVSAETQGSVADGYIAGATVFIDVDGDGLLGSDEPFTITDAAGQFSLISPFGGAILAVGGTNIDTGLDNNLVLAAPEGATVVNPLTTLIQALVSDEVSVAEAEAQVKEALGLSPLLALTELDLIEAANDATDPAAQQLALQAQKAAVSIAEVLNAVVENDGDQGDALTSVAELVQSGEPVDLTNAATLNTVITDGGVAPAAVNQLVLETQSVTLAVANATSLDGLSDIQDNQGPVAAADESFVNEDAKVAGNLTSNDSDPDAGEVVTVSSVNGISLSGETVIRGSFGSLTIAPDGSYEYAADGDILDAYTSGNVLEDEFTYVATDGKGGIAQSTLTIDITTVNDVTTLRSGKSGNVTGSGKDEKLLGNEGVNTLNGGGGADQLFGYDGKDTLHGGDGFDLLIGGEGKDSLYGGNDDDLLVGGAGGDGLWGGAGSDVFVFGTGSGADTIADFAVGIDTIYLADGVLLMGMAAGASSTTLQLSNGASVVLAGLTGPIAPNDLLASSLPDWADGLLLA